jgi:hypothetical protein
MQPPSNSVLARTLPGTYLIGVRNFGLIEASVPRKQRKLTLKTIDANGKEWWKHEIAEGELTFPKSKAAGAS